MTGRRAALLLVSFGLILSSWSAVAQIRRRPEVDEKKTISRIAFGSCAVQDRPQPIWDRVTATRPDVFLFIGDNIYGDSQDMNEMKAKYELLDAIPGFRRLSRRVPILATWDDHDYGLNDGGEEFPKRAESQQVFLDFFGVPADSPRRSRAGVYNSVIVGQPGRRIQFILLDTRYHRSMLKTKAPDDPMVGRYVPDDNPNKTMLGEEQWGWLAEQLAKPAELRIIASSIQVLAEDHGWEKWMNLPREREKLFRLIRDTRAAGVLFISGDRHLAELSMMDADIGYPIYDLTASGMNNASHNWRLYETNRHRVGTMNWGNNFGLITVDWSKADPIIALQIRDTDGDINIQRKLPLSILQPKAR